MECTEPDEATCNQTVHVKLESEVERLTNEVHRLQNQMGIDDMSHDELEEIQRILLESDAEDVVEVSAPDAVPNYVALIQVKQEIDVVDAQDDYNLNYDGSSIEGELGVSGSENHDANVSSTAEQPSQSVEVDGATNNVSSDDIVQTNSQSFDAILTPRTPALIQQVLKMPIACQHNKNRLK